MIADAILVEALVADDCGRPRSLIALLVLDRDHAAIRAAVSTLVTSGHLRRCGDAYRLTQQGREAAARLCGEG